MQLHVASLDLRQDFDRATPNPLCDAIVDCATHPTLAMALQRERVGGRHKVRLQGLTVDEVGFDTAIKHGGKETSSVVCAAFVHGVIL